MSAPPGWGRARTTLERSARRAKRSLAFSELAGDFYEEVQSLLPAPMSTDSQRPQALMFFTSLCERAMWRYRDPRSWRAFIIDVGHAEYMCAEVCAALGLTLKFCHGISSQPLAEFLSVDPFRQPIMSVATLSTACGAVEDKE